VHVRRPGRPRPRLVAALAVLATAASLVTAPSFLAEAAPPPNPTNGQISAAQAQKNALADQVGQLSARAATLQAQLGQMKAKQELAEQKLAYALQLLEQAKQTAQQASATVRAAQAKVQGAQLEFVAYAQASYMSGTIGGTTGSLLTADDPNVLLQQGALEQYQSSHQLGAISDLQRAKVGKSNADAAARKAVLAQTSATAAAAAAKQAADDAVTATIAQEQQVQQAIAANQTKLDSARQLLAQLNGQRAKYDAWKREQERLAEIRRKQAAERRRQAELARQRAEQNRNQGGGGGGGGSSWSPPPAPSGGHWTAARGQQAVNRAEGYLGWMYAWAGGNAGGPTRGVCAGDGAYNDCNIVGFDCSGLVMYAWGPYLNLAHYAASQYTQAGSYHPSSGNFRPGDLLFWSSDGTIGGIHHVAIYVGGGNVIQAPQSGSVIQITPWDQVSWGYFGATRPLT
jgi:peptidoglycan DL-endopeptidase RipA